MNEQVLLVEDDPALSELATLILERVGFETSTVADGEAALERFRKDPFDLILLDVMLPVRDGLEVCRTIRATSSVPIIMLTAKDDTSDVVAGLEVGADDYITKPFKGPELVARIRAVLRRTSSETDEVRHVVGDLEIDPAAYVCTKGGRPVDLSATEFRLLLELVRHPRRVLTRPHLLRHVWEYEYVGDTRLVDMAIKRLREKIEDNPSAPRLVQTVRGVGYCFDPP
jgi:two-component system response regulator MtrA